MFATGWTLDYIEERVTPAQLRVLIMEHERKKRRDAQLDYLVTKIAVVEAMTGQTVKHNLFDDPEDDGGPKVLDDATLIGLGFVKEG